jgi:hypothetical protein
MNLIRKIFIPSGKEEILTHDMWVVSWKSRYGQFCGEVRTNYQSFFSEKDALVFKKSLDDANKLIGNTDQTEVGIERRKNGE